MVDPKRRGLALNLFGLLTLLAILSLLLPGCAVEQKLSEEGKMALSISSDAFQDGGQIPSKYTCDGQDISPQLAWGGPPQGTKAFALIVDDPGAPSGVFTHWVLFNLPADTRQLAEGIPSQSQLQNGALQGKNDFGKIGYSGPCPPRGTTHQYRFTLYALDKLLDLKAGATKKQILEAVKGYVLAQGQLRGVYQH